MGIHITAYGLVGWVTVEERLLSLLIVYIVRNITIWKSIQLLMISIILFLN